MIMTVVKQQQTFFIVVCLFTQPSRKDKGERLSIT